MPRSQQSVPGQAAMPDGRCFQLLKPADKVLVDAVQRSGLPDRLNVCLQARAATWLASCEELEVFKICHSDTCADKRPSTTSAAFRHCRAAIKPSGTSSSVVLHLAVITCRSRASVPVRPGAADALLVAGTYLICGVQRPRELVTLNTGWVSTPPGT